MKNFAITTFLFFTIIVNDCTAAIKDFIVEYTEPIHLNYGTEINFSFHYLNKKGKKKELRFNDMDKISLEVVNGEFNFHPDNILLLGKLVLMPRPNTVKDSLIKIKFIYREDEQVFNREFEFVLNHRGKMVLNYNGRDGAEGGNSADNRLFFTSGAEGNQGHNGENAKHVKAEILYSDDSLNTDMQVTFLATNEIFTYRLKPSTTEIFITCSGGNGGKGGDGNAGNSNKEFRLDGGDGGNGGHGGNGGQITVYIPKKLESIRKKLILLNYGGQGGAAGNGGNGAEFIDDKTKKGRNGLKGVTGNAGFSGAPPEIIIGE